MPPVSTPQADRGPRWFDKISRSTRSCLFSRRSRASSSRSVADKPATTSSRRPSCLSATAAQAAIDCAVGSNSRASSSGDRPARTRSTTWRRNSGEYGGRVLGIRSTFGESFRVSTKPGQSQTMAPFPVTARQTGRADFRIGFLLSHQTFALGRSARRRGRAYRPSVSKRYLSGIWANAAPLVPIVAATSDGHAVWCICG